MAREAPARFALLLLVVVLGCGRSQPRAHSWPPKDWAELEARYDELDTGMTEQEIAAVMGKAGGALAGYSSQMMKRKPADGSAGMANGESMKGWASDDWKGGVEVVFRSDGKARLIALLRLTPMGPVPRLRDEADGP
jgi:hypothetical protein